MSSSNPFTGGGSSPFGAGPIRPSTDWQNLRLADFVQFNAATFVSGSVTDNGGSAGWSIPLLGGSGKSVADPFDGWHAITASPITDALGGVLTVANEWVAWLALHEVSGVTASPDIDVVIGICNGPTNGASLDWAGCGFRLGATRTCLSITGADGVAAATAGTATDVIRRVQFPLVKVGTVTSSMMRPFVRYLDGSNAAQAALTGGASTATNAEAGGDRGWADGPPHLFVAAYRTSTTDTTTRTPCFQPLRSPSLGINPPS